MFKTLLSAICMVLLTAQFAFAQTGAVSGRVTDANTGEPIPGAHILIPTLDRGDVSNRDGYYRIANLPVGTHTVRVSFVGYRSVTQTVDIQANVTTELDLALGVEAIRFDELVVTGYAVTPKRELTGSISRVEAREIRDIPLQNVESLLQGRAAGVQVQLVSGNPGGAFRVQVRGQGSVNAASEPLYIIDGVQISHSGLSPWSTSPLNYLHPDDIESIEVLKDQASAAIYGSQAASGVVIINTKRGTEGATQVSVSVERGSRWAGRYLDYLNRDEWLNYIAEARAINQYGFNYTDSLFQVAYDHYYYGNGQLLDVYGSPTWSSEDWFNFRAMRTAGLNVRQALDTLGLSDELADLNWNQDFIFKTGNTQRYTVSATGGDQTTRFYISGGYEDTQGHIYNTTFDRMHLRTNLDQQITSRLNSSINLNLARTFQFGVCEDGNFINCPSSQAMFEPPFSFPFYTDGEYSQGTNFGPTTNPAVTWNEVERNSTVVSIRGDAKLHYRVTDWMMISGMVGLDYRRTEDEQYESIIARPAQGGFLVVTNRDVENYITNLVANMRRTFDGVHNLSGIVGTEWRRNYTQLVQVRGDGFPGTFFKVLNASSTPITAAGTFGEWRVGSFFTNAQYNYDQRYFLSLVGRFDGHSRFGEEKRWGFFPSISGAWRITEENFFNIGWINELKLRAGYGTAGNAAIGNYQARGLYSAVGSYMGETALLPAQLANVNLTWEESREVNVGLDLAFFEGRISAEFDVYRRRNERLLFDRNLPSDSGFGQIIENIGVIQNDGLELALNSVNIHTRDFSWSSRFNIGFLANEIIELPRDEDGEFIVINPFSFTQTLEVGHPLGVLFAPRWAGVNPADGRPMWYDGEGNLTYTPSQIDDGIHYKDGVQNITGGFGNTLNYRGLSLDVFFEFSFGQWAFANTDWFFTRTPDFTMNLDRMVEDRWRQPGDITYFPRAIEAGTDFPETANFRTQIGTHGIYNASYIRLKNITLSYNLPRTVTDRLNVRGLRLYATGVNLHLWTAWPFYDPEIAFSPTDIFGNITIASHPGARQINTGIELQF